MKECTVCQFWQRFTTDGWTPFHINHTRPPWNQPEIKDALNYAMDRAKFSQIVTQGWSEPPKGGLHRPDSKWAMPYEIVKTIPGYNMEDPEGNKAKARELLAKVGYKPGELELPLIVWAPNQVPNSVFVKGELDAVGFKVNPLPTTTANFYNAITAGDFNVMLHSFSLGGDDPDLILFEHFFSGSDRNYGRYVNYETDRLILEMSAMADPELRKRQAWKIEEILLRDHAKDVFGWSTTQLIMNKRVRDYIPGNSAHGGHGTPNRHETTWFAE